MVTTALLFLVSFGNQALAQDDEKLVILETNLGTIVIEFFAEDAPNHVDNFTGLVESGFYDETLFHRIIPGFMIQGGDPNTIDGDPSTWGTGGPAELLNAEFNTIKHNRGIVSMARSTDPNSAGSQFFIVHKDSNFLDEQYTVFGRITTEESFETLDKIASVETGDRYIPIDTEPVKITKVTTTERANLQNILELSEPERTQSTVTPSTGNQKFESMEHGVRLSMPEGWLLQEPEKIQENSPDVVAVGPKVGLMNPVISLTVEQNNEKTFDDLISEKAETLSEVIESGNLKIISQEKTTVNGNQVYVTNAETYNVKFKELVIYDTEKIYTLVYSNDVDNFDSQLPRFEITIDSFELLYKDTLDDKIVKEGGDCLIATAAYGSEMAPQVQLLREIRDNQLMGTNSGVLFMTGFNQFYYSFSPVIADYERENPAFKEMVKIGITPLLSSLSIMSYAESEGEILGYGIGVILMNLGMYVGIPAVTIYKIRK